jgi:hypothetical protein
MSALLMDIGGVVHVDAETEFEVQHLTIRAPLWASLPFCRPRRCVFRAPVIDRRFEPFGLNP